MPFTFSFRKPSTTRASNISGPLSKKQLAVLGIEMDAEMPAATTDPGQISLGDMPQSPRARGEHRLRSIREAGQQFQATARSPSASSSQTTIVAPNEHTPTTQAIPIANKNEKRYGMVFDQDVPVSDSEDSDEAKVRFVEPAIIKVACRKKRPVRVMRPVVFCMGGDVDVPLASPHLTRDSLPPREIKGRSGVQATVQTTFHRIQRSLSKKRNSDPSRY